MKLLFTLMIALFAFISVSAQPSSEAWTTFSPAGEEFSVKIPASMSTSNHGKQPDRKDWDATYEVATGGVRYYIFSEGPLSAGSVDTGMEFINSFKPKGESVGIDDLTGEKFFFIDDEGFSHAALHVKFGDNRVLFHAFASSGDSALEKFVNSVTRSRNQVLPVIPDGSSVTLPDDSIPDSPESSTLPGKGSGIGNGVGTGGGMGSGRGSGSGTGSGSGSGLGIGSGSGSGVGSGGGASSPEPKGATTPFRILSKPRPGYTDAARSYNIQGTVTLRITFLGSGEIGSISAVTKLPLGLTKSAIKAARSIRFEPQTKDGIPMSVSKTLQYTFTIY